MLLCVFDGVVDAPGGSCPRGDGSVARGGAALEPGLEAALVRALRAVVARSVVVTRSVAAVVPGLRTTIEAVLHVAESTVTTEAVLATVLRRAEPVLATEATLAIESAVGAEAALRAEAVLTAEGPRRAEALPAPEAATAASSRDCSPSSPPPGRSSDRPDRLRRIPRQRVKCRG